MQRRSSCSDQRIPITYTLYGPADTPVGRIELEYSPDGGGRWLPAVPTTDTLTTSLAAAPFPSTTLTNTHVYTWDTFASGFFDQSDNVVLRLRAYPGTGVARNGVPDAQPVALRRRLHVACARARHPGPRFR